MGGGSVAGARARGLISSLLLEDKVKYGALHLCILLVVVVLVIVIIAHCNHCRQMTSWLIQSGNNPLIAVQCYLYQITCRADGR